MLDPEREAMLERFAAWGAADPRIRAVVLTSSLAVLNGPADALSDYDQIVVVEDVAPFSADRAWLNDFGPVLVANHDPLREERGYQRFACITQYDRYKIDFTVQPVGLWRLQAADRPLGPDLDLGYRVLLDKDGLTAGMPAPTHRARLRSPAVPQPPSPDEYRQAVELFFHEGTYAAKSIWRQDAFAVHYFLECAMKRDHLIEMLTWHMELEHGWSVRPGVLGRGLLARLPAGLREEAAAALTSGGLERAWEDFDRLVDLFTRVARDVGAGLGYAYPAEMEARARAHYAWVRGLPH